MGKVFENESRQFCYVMLYPDSKSFSACFDNGDEAFSPTDFGEDFLVGINGPLDKPNMDQLLVRMDQKLGIEPQSLS